VVSRARPAGRGIPQTYQDIHEDQGKSRVRKFERRWMGGGGSTRREPNVASGRGSFAATTTYIPTPPFSIVRIIIDMGERKDSRNVGLLCTSSWGGGAKMGRETLWR
jgi:hypothetical protein